MKEYRDREIGEIERRQLIYPRTSTPTHKEYDSEEVHDGTQELLDGLEEGDNEEVHDGTQGFMDGLEEGGS